VNLMSPGYRSQLIFADFDGQAVDRGNYWAIHTFTNPNFFWGNLVIFDRPPRKGDLERWPSVFRREFTNPSIYHVTLAWDSASGEIGDVSEFLENGFLFESNAVLSTHKVIRPPKFNEELEVRIISGQDEWRQMIRVQVASSGDHLSKAEWESFSVKQSGRYQAMEKTGMGHWYGGFFEGKLVAGLGLFHRDGLGRFQTVSTDPEFQRKGFCQTLVYLSSQQALASGKVSQLVMCADPAYHAIKIYESVGFKQQHLEHGVYWWNKERAK
jgi:ribosomal protein S18 acetylase RimI-like enzyme